MISTRITDDRVMGAGAGGEPAHQGGGRGGMDQRRIEPAARSARRT